MRIPSSSSRFLLLALLPMFWFAACSSAPDTSKDDEPAALSKEADELMEANRYVLALEKLQELKNRHPYSPQAVDAQLRMADVYYLQENFSEAAATYEAFRDLHPKHAKVRYAMYRAANAYFKDIPDLHARDLTPAFKAQDAYKEFLNQFPTGEFSDNAKKELAETRDDLADKELYIANFYYKHDNYEAAKGRYQKILSAYADTKAKDEADKKLGQSEKKIAAGKEKEAGMKAGGADGSAGNSTLINTTSPSDAGSAGVPGSGVGP